jgi:hypothetical protein
MVVMWSKLCFFKGLFCLTSSSSSAIHWPRQPHLCPRNTLIQFNRPSRAPVDERRAGCCVKHTGPSDRHWGWMVAWKDKRRKGRMVPSCVCRNRQEKATCLWSKGCYTRQDRWVVRALGVIRTDMFCNVVACIYVPLFLHSFRCFFGLTPMYNEMIFPSY